MKKLNVLPLALSACLYGPLALAAELTAPPAETAEPPSIETLTEASESSADPTVDGLPAVETEAATESDADSSDAQSPPAVVTEIEEIVVTAQKRQESVNTVPMSISALSADMLTKQGINSVGDLQKVVPGFRYTQSSYSTPIYSIRGIGFNESSLGAKPNVSVYVDEIPLPFPILTAGASMDLQRVEVLKGPQGTLFGQNSTGGAVNYIAAKPTDHFTAGISDEYGRFNSTTLEGFVSGPLSETVKGRIALKSEQAGPWQQSYTSDNENGSKDKISSRILLDWTPSDVLRTELSLNGYWDQSDEQAAQLIAITPLNRTLVDKYAPFLNTYPLSPEEARSADWGPRDGYERDNRFFQTALRVDYDLSSTVTLTSISSYSHYRQDRIVDPDGTSFRNIQYRTDGKIDSVNQELRLTGSLGERTRWIVGGNYAKDKVKQRDDGDVTDNGNAYALGEPPYTTFFNYSNQTFDTIAAFGNIDFDFTDTLTGHLAARYTEADLDFAGCTGDIGGALSAAWNRTFGTSVAPNECITTEATATGLVAGLKHRELNEKNTSWRTGLDWKITQGSLLYANVSKGYKSGSFPILSASFAGQFTPAKQESVLAYETGFKSRLLDGKMQVNGAVFYYDYKDKQVRGRVIDPVFNALEALVNVPESNLKGAELQVTWLPIAGLTANVGGTYIDSEIEKFENFDPYANKDPFNPAAGSPAVRDLGGDAFPLTSKWQGFADLQYEWPLHNDLMAFVGGNLSHQSATNGGLGDLPILDIDAYTLLDLRAGLESGDSAWRFTVWGRNVTNEYYWTIADHVSDTTVRYTGMPATYGITVAYRYR